MRHLCPTWTWGRHILQQATHRQAALCESQARDVRTNSMVNWYLLNQSRNALFLWTQVLFMVIAQSVQRWATGWTIGVLGIDSRRGLGIFLLTTASTTALGPTQPPIQCVQGALSLGVKRTGCEADHSPPSSARVKNASSYTFTPSIGLHGVVLSYRKAQGQLYLLPFTCKNNCRERRRVSWALRSFHSATVKPMQSL
jgi:hypothetical protein